MENKKFAKLFDMPDGGQVLIHKVYDEENDKAILSTQSMIKDFIVEMHLGFKSIEDRDKAFESRTQEKAEDIYQKFKEQV